MRERAAFAWVVILASPCLAACDETSANVKTSDIEAAITVDLRKDSKTIDVDMMDSFSHVTLAKGDSLSATTDKDTGLKFTKSVSYSATLPNDDITMVTVSLTRTAEPSAPSSTVAVPPHFMFTSATQVSYAAGDPKVTWSNPVSGADITFLVRPCSADVHASTETEAHTADSGSLVIPIATLANPAPAAGSSTCTTVTLIRKVTGTTDKAFSSMSTIDAVRYEDVNITITP